MGDGIEVCSRHTTTEGLHMEIESLEVVSGSGIHMETEPWRPIINYL